MILLIARILSALMVFIHSFFLPPLWRDETLDAKRTKKDQETNMLPRSGHLTPRIYSQ
jgi:hypothetical protein